MKFVVMKSGFGDYWIGKFDETKADLPEEVLAFDDYQDALDKALGMNDSIVNQAVLKSEKEEEIELLPESMLKWIA